MSSDELIIRPAAGADRAFAAADFLARETPMEPRLSFITLGVRDLERATLWESD